MGPGFGIGGGIGGDDRNTGPRGKIKRVKDLAKVSAEVGESGMVFSTGEIKGAPDTASPVSVPYTDVLADYRKAAENALAREKVPPAYRTRVKEYFGSLNR
jgi:hypothetical protein